MPGFVINMLTPVFCSHGGKATPVPPMGRVMMMGIGAVTLAHAYVIVGCTAPAALLPPCVAGMFTMGTLRVRTMGIPLIIIPPTGPSFCPGNPTPLIPAPAIPPQPRVIAM
jgi:hypothetical protein